MLKNKILPMKPTTKITRPSNSSSTACATNKKILIACMALTIGGLSKVRAQTVVETFDDGLANTRFSEPIISKDNASTPDDALVDYAFDYSTLGIPPAPNTPGSTTVGIAFGSNLTDQILGDEGESVGVTSSISLPDGDFVITADVYLYIDQASGTTEEAFLGVYSDGSSVPLLFEEFGSGVQFTINTDGDSFSNADYTRILGGATNNYGDLGEWQDIPDGSIPRVPTGNRGSVGPFNQWVELELRNSAGQLSFRLNGFELATYDNTDGRFSGGSLVLGGGDLLNSVNPNNRQIFDNLVVTDASDGSAEEFRVFITPAVPPATGFDLQWPSTPGKTYNVRTSTDLTGAVSTWDLVQAGITATPPMNRLNVDLGGNGDSTQLKNLARGDELDVSDLNQTNNRVQALGESVV